VSADSCLAADPFFAVALDDDVRAANLEKKWLHCLRCHKPMWTNRCQRICIPCTRRNENASPREAAHLPRDVLALLEADADL